jgi:hypothetical protein
MAAQTVSAQNVGWVSQHEVTFTVPLEWWRRENGQLVFKDWACVSPFIFVDDQMSLTTGREVYGWPKILATVDADLPPWTTNPLAGERLFSLSVPVFPKLYAGKHEEPRVLVQIDRTAPPTYSTMPFDPNNPWNPLTAMADAARAWLGMTQEAFEILWARAIALRGTARHELDLEMSAGRHQHDPLAPELLVAGHAKARNRRQAERRNGREHTLKQFRAVEAE